MPTYEFRCPNGHVFEKAFPTITKTRRLKCPTCGKMGERLISCGVGLVFKGSGFYITDYKRAGQKPDKSEKAEKTEKVEKPAPKKDTKTDK